MAEIQGIGAGRIRSVHFQYDRRFQLTPTDFQLEEWARDPQSGHMSETALELWLRVLNAVGGYNEPSISIDPHVVCQAMRGNTPRKTVFLPEQIALGSPSGWNTQIIPHSDPRHSHHIGNMDTRSSTQAPQNVVTAEAQSNMVAAT